MTNFSPFKGDSEKHPWMGFDRYRTADRMLTNAAADFIVLIILPVIEAHQDKVLNDIALRENKENDNL